MAKGLSVYRQCLRSVQQSTTAKHGTELLAQTIIDMRHLSTAGFKGDQFMLQQSRRELRSKFEVTVMHLMHNFLIPLAHLVCCITMLLQSAVKLCMHLLSLLLPL